MALDPFLGLSEVEVIVVAVVHATDLLLASSLLVVIPELSQALGESSKDLDLLFVVFD